MSSDTSFNGRSGTAVVLNPSAAGGRTAAAWHRIRPRLEGICGPVVLCYTRAPGHGVELTCDAVRAGSGTVIAIGGDGTLNEVVNGVMLAGEAFDPVVGLIPQGTGSDFRRTLNIPLDESGALETIRKRSIQSIDLMRVAYRSKTGAEETRYAMNVTSFGMGGRVAARANRSSKPLGGKVTFLTATLVTALGYQADHVTITLDDVTIPEVPIMNVAIGNGQYHGAGMWICPSARIDDGLLDVTIVQRLSLLELVRGSRFLFNGRIEEHPKVRTYRTTRCSAQAVGGGSAIEIDGEPVGELPISINVVPNAIRMIVPGAL